MSAHAPETVEPVPVPAPPAEAGPEPLPELTLGDPELAPRLSTTGDTQRWLLSYYRTSEISGALFFGRLARAQPPGEIQEDLTRHFADEAQHARYWTDCIAELGGHPLRLKSAYQDQYLAAAGMPANLMEVLAITSVFERRVVNQYARHLAVPELEPAIARTLTKIMEDERWHIFWVREALRGLEHEYGHDHVLATVRRFQQADRDVYHATIDEHEERLAFLHRRSGHN